MNTEVFLCSYLICKKNMRRTLRLSAWQAQSLGACLPHSFLVRSSTEERREKLPIVRVMLVFSCPVPICFSICPYLSISNHQHMDKNKALVSVSWVVFFSCPYLSISIWPNFILMCTCIGVLYTLHLYVQNVFYKNDMPNMANMDNPVFVWPSAVHIFTKHMDKIGTTAN